MNAPIRLDDRISTVLARDERLLDVLVAASPALAKLRNPILRKTMSKLATVEQAARVAGLDATDLLARLNSALEGKPYEPTSGAARKAPSAAEAPPSAILDTPEDRIVDLDVREDLRAGREPFGRILEATHRVQAGEVLRLRAIFEPVPLYAVLGRQGFAHFTERLEEDDWRVWFWRDAGAASEAKGAKPAPSAAAGEDEDLVVIDVRGLEPPEPMVRTLEALERLPRGKTLLQINERVPQFLIPQLAKRGFVHEVREQSADLVRIFIRHANT